MAVARMDRCNSRISRSARVSAPAPGFDTWSCPAGPEDWGLRFSCVWHLPAHLSTATCVHAYGGDWWVTCTGSRVVVRVVPRPVITCACTMDCFTENLRAFCCQFSNWKYCLVFVLRELHACLYLRVCAPQCPALAQLYCVCLHGGWVRVKVHDQYIQTRRAMTSPEHVPVQQDTAVLHHLCTGRLSASAKRHCLPFLSVCHARCATPSL